MPSQLQVIRFSVDLNEADLLLTGRKVFEQIRKTGVGFFATINGFDDDPRELWQIPEAIKFAQLVRDTGLISILEFATSLRDFPTQWPADEVRPFLGAFEMWTIADGKDILLKDSVDTKYVKNIIDQLQFIDQNFRSKMLMEKTGNKIIFEGHNRVRSTPQDFENSKVSAELENQLRRQNGERS